VQPSDFPLAWPEGRDRTPHEKRVVGRFTIPFQGAYDTLLNAAERLHDSKDRDVIISANIPLGVKGLPLVSVTKERLADPGVAVYIWKDGKPYVVACDNYLEVGHNLRAIWATIESFRTISRHGTSALLEQSMSGFCREIRTDERPQMKQLAAGG
jgi:hypothetical protein